LTWISPPTAPPEASKSCANTPHDEATGIVHRHRGVGLVAGGERVHLELAVLGDAGGVEALGEDAQARAVVEALPGDHEVAVGVHRHRRKPLRELGFGVDLELDALRVAGGVVPTREDPFLGNHRVLLTDARPHDDEVAGVGHGDRGAVLRSGGERVDLERTALGGAGRVVALSEDAPARAVLAFARPDHDEVAVVGHGDRALLLVTGGYGVDYELSADRRLSANDGGGPRSEEQTGSYKG
jgi:hypothetical protein